MLRAVSGLSTFAMTRKIPAGGGKSPFGQYPFGAYSMQYGKFASLYDLLMRGVDYGAWADYVSGFMPPGAFAAECACGTGEISLRLAKKGFTVTASDISEDMLMRASEKQRGMGVAPQRLRFVRMDMRSLSLHKKADCVISCCDGVNYLLSREDVKRFFAAAYANLKPAGLLLFDVSSRYKLEKVLGNGNFSDNGEEAPFIWTNEYDPQTKLIRMELSFFKKRDGLYERFDETHIQRAHSLRELGSWLNETGFEYKAYDCFTMEPVKPESERIQFAAIKKE